MSKSSQRRNPQNVTSKSVGKASSQGGNSFAQSKVSGPGMKATANSAASGNVGANIVIDIESESLTYNQARSIRL